MHFTPDTTELKVIKYYDALLYYITKQHSIITFFDFASARLNLYTSYAEALTKGEGTEVDNELDRIEEIIRKGEEMNLFQ